MSKVVLSALLSTVYKLDSEEIAEILKNSDDLQESSKGDQAIIDSILAKDKDRVTEFKAREKKRFDDGHKKGKSESLAQLEEEIRDEYGVDKAEKRART
jgi:hypothetical protein